jgi:RNA polymerase sigma-70 factor (ECF subfamily)
MTLPGLGSKPDLRREFEALAIPLQRDLYAFAFRLTGRREEAEDLAQEALLRAYKSFHRFEKGTKFKAWLFRIATNLYINSYRRKKRRPVPLAFEELGTEDHPLEIPDASPGLQPEKTAMARAAAIELWQTVDRLPEPYRLAVILCDVEELSYEEAAAVMKTPIGTIRSRLFRGRRWLREHLTAGEEERG